MKSSNLSNLISNYGTKLWSLVSVFIFIPVYIHYLGIEAYAVVGFYALLLGIISFADAGMSSAVIREFASDAEPAYKYSVLILIERIYVFICASIATIVFFFAETIGRIWLTSEKIPLSDLTFYIQLIGIGTSLQLLSSLYFGALFGLNNQIGANTIQIIWNIFKSGFVIALLIIFTPDLKTFFFWQILCNLVYILVLRYNTILHLKKTGAQLSLLLKKVPVSILKYICGMTLIAIISAINTQADKIITSSFFTLKIFGYYNIASTVSQIPMMVALPLSMSVFPLFSRFSSASDQLSTNTVFQKAAFLLHILVFPVFVTIFLYSSEIIYFWTGTTIEPYWFDKILTVIKLLTLGSTFLALQVLPYYLLLSKGKTKYTIYQGLIQILIGIPLLYFSVRKLGILGAGIPWVIINAGALVYLYSITFKKYLTLKMFLFFRNSIMMPFAINIFVALFLFLCYKKSSIPFYFFISLSIPLSIFINILINNYKNKIPLLNIKNIYDFSNE